jgi:hypothetical protein
MFSLLIDSSHTAALRGCEFHRSQIVLLSQESSISASDYIVSSPNVSSVVCLDIGRPNTQSHQQRAVALSGRV